MFTRITQLLAGFCICFCLAPPVLAWNFLGHQVVAQIAYNHLDPEVKIICDNLLTNAVPCGTFSSSFITSSTWADGRCESGTAPQHYTDIWISLDGTTTNGLYDDPVNVVSAIQQHIATLQNPASNQTAKATALRYLIHFVGDIQQPLHCSAAVWASNPDGDAGGNQFSLGSGNLHSFWDSGGGYLSSGTASSKAVDVETNYAYSFSIGLIPDPYDWAWEGREIARTNTYVGVTNGLPASASYSNRTQAATKQRMAIGGQRLAKLLSTILVTNAPSLTSVTFTNDNFGLSWTAVPGRIYRVQWKQQLSDPAWTDLTDVTTSTNSISFTEATIQTQRFYRVIVVN